FSKKTIIQLNKQFGFNLKDSTVDTYISRFLQNKEILPLKNGLYVSADFLDKHRNDISYVFYLANILRKPSYISSWSALQYYNLATEAIYSITSVTPKVTRSYKTKAGNFAYQSMQKDLFSDFLLVKGEPASSAGKFDFFIATPAKALFDLLYFKTHQFRGVQMKDINPLIKELRIDFDEMDKDEQSKFYTIIKKYLSYE
ncbi:MAG: hypothetical protein CO042_00060, partial [Parcubacteria group bacterium CG_4_9_14_0_2_um_filter_41_8]